MATKQHSRLLSVKRILVTGGAGYSGRWLVRKLCDLGYAVRAGDIMTPPLSSPLPSPNADRSFHGEYDGRAEWVRLDVTSVADIESSLRGIDTVFHVAAIVPYNLPSAIPSSALFTVNITGTYNLLTAAKKAGVRNFIFASSTGVVFGGDDIENGSEDIVKQRKPIGANGTEVLTAALEAFDRKDFNDDYSYSKAVAEGLVRAFSSPEWENGMATVSIRPNGIWGVGENHHIPKLLVTATLGGSKPVFGQHALTDFTHRDNLVHAFTLALNKLTSDPGSRKTVAGKAYFVTDGWACHTVEFFSPLLQGLGFGAPFPSVIVPAGTVVRRQDGTTLKLVHDGRGDPQTFQAAEAYAIAQAESSASGPRTKEKPIEHIVITGPAEIPLPGFLLYPVALLLEWLSFLMRPFLSIEPFLTSADVRKVVKHNYYSSKLAEKELGYTPVRSAASGILELIPYYAAEGYSGVVASPPRAAYFAVIFGLSLTAVLAFNMFGALDEILALMDPNIVSTAAGLLRQCFQLMGMSSLFGELTREMGATCATIASVTITDSHTISFGLQAIFWSAMLCHGLQGLWAFAFAYTHNKNALAWAYQTALLGFPSSTLLVQSTGHDAAYVQAICVSGFAACIPLVVGTATTWIALTACV